MYIDNLLPYPSSSDTDPAVGTEKSPRVRLFLRTGLSRHPAASRQDSRFARDDDTGERHQAPVHRFSLTPHLPSIALKLT